MDSIWNLKGYMTFQTSHRHHQYNVHLNCSLHWSIW